MRSAKQHLERHDWKLRLPDATQLKATPAASSPIAFLNAVWQGLVKMIIGGNDLRVWQASDDDGYMHWRAYDPVTGETVVCDSEDEMRVWIEQRYHHHPDESQQWYQKQYYQLLPLR